MDPGIEVVKRDLAGAQATQAAQATLAAAAQSTVPAPGVPMATPSAAGTDASLGSHKLKEGENPLWWIAGILVTSLAGVGVLSYGGVKVSRRRNAYGDDGGSQRSDAADAGLDRLFNDPNTSSPEREGLPKNVIAGIAIASLGVVATLAVVVVPVMLHAPFGIGRSVEPSIPSSPTNRVPVTPIFAVLKGLHFGMRSNEIGPSYVRQRITNQKTEDFVLEASGLRPLARFERVDLLGESGISGVELNKLVLRFDKETDLLTGVAVGFRNHPAAGAVKTALDQRIGKSGHPLVTDAATMSMRYTWQSPESRVALLSVPAAVVYDELSRGAYLTGTLPP